MNLDWVHRGSGPLLLWGALGWAAVSHLRRLGADPAFGWTALKFVSLLFDRLRLRERNAGGGVLAALCGDVLALLHGA